MEVDILGRGGSFCSIFMHKFELRFRSMHGNPCHSVGLWFPSRHGTYYGRRWVRIQYMHPSYMYCRTVVAFERLFILQVGGSHQIENNRTCLRIYFKFRNVYRTGKMVWVMITVPQVDEKIVWENYLLKRTRMKLRLTKLPSYRALGSFPTLRKRFWWIKELILIMTRNNFTVQYIIMLMDKRGINNESFCGSNYFFWF